MRFFIIASGSKGNSIFIETDYTRLLIDAGISANKIAEKLESYEIEPQTIDAIVLTHSHTDHVRGVGRFSKRYGVPIYAHPETLDSVTNLLKQNQGLVPWYQAFQIKDIRLKPFKLSHDCEPTFGYLIEDNYKSLAICTDLGVATNNVKETLHHANSIILESNHDTDMLIMGRYPYYLKERISSRVGHLSNYEAGNLLRAVIHTGIQQVILGHLSDENNTPQMALETVLSINELQVESILSVISQDQSSQIFQL
jgi:phosphoribosyl 1,2-cyclic phosphodiesterase